MDEKKLKYKQFRFKQFTINHSTSGMKIGTDGVLLGAWADLQDAKHILDIGTGSGLIALMAAQRNSSAHIRAIEVDAQASREAERNFQGSPWSERLSILEGDYLQVALGRTFDHIICNPPFFAHSAPGNKQRTYARSSESLPHNKLLRKALTDLSEPGKLSVVLPVAEAEAFEREAFHVGFHLSRICRVQPKVDAQPKRFLMEFGKGMCPTDKTELAILGSDGKDYTRAYIQMVKEFYLKM